MSDVHDPGGADRDLGWCLSGGGYRALVFHVGALIRLNEAGILPRLRTVSSVSGGSITAAWLGLRWKHLTFDHRGVATNLDHEVVQPLMKFAAKGMDIAAVFRGAFIPGAINRQAQAIYRARLFGDAALVDLPARNEGPEFVITATNLGTGKLWRFSNRGVGDFRSDDDAPEQAGFFQAPTIPIALAVAASSGFPPILSPCIVDCAPFADARAAQRTVRLSDGGVFDNLGLEPLDDEAVKTVLCSDAGAPFKRTARPPRTYLLGTVHVLKVIDYQVRKLRRSELIGSAIRGERRVALWTIDDDPAAFLPAAGGFEVLSTTKEARQELATVSTRLAKLSKRRRERLANWGYAICDTSIRRWLDAGPIGAYPFPGGIG